jgi:hypothetical protein
MEKGEIISMEKIAYRKMHLDTLWEQIIFGKPNIVMSWGVSQKVVDCLDKQRFCSVFRMKVSGHHHKGFVYIALNFLDLYDVYYTKMDGTIVDKHENVYFDQLQEVIDNRIERIKYYCK